MSKSNSKKLPGKSLKKSQNIYDKIYNPKTKKFVSIYGKLGQSILKNYILHGGANYGAPYPFPPYGQGGPMMPYGQGGPSMRQGGPPMRQGGPGGHIPPWQQQPGPHYRGSPSPSPYDQRPGGPMGQRQTGPLRGPGRPPQSQRQMMPYGRGGPRYMGPPPQGRREPPDYGRGGPPQGMRQNNKLLKLGFNCGRTTGYKDCMLYLQQKANDLEDKGNIIHHISIITYSIVTGTFTYCSLFYTKSQSQIRQNRLRYHLIESSKGDNMENFLDRSHSQINTLIQQRYKIINIVNDAYKGGALGFNHWVTVIFYR